MSANLHVDGVFKRMSDADLEAAAAAAGLTAFLELDAPALARARTAALSYQSRRVVVSPDGDEPAHVFRPEAGTDDA